MLTYLFFLNFTFYFLLIVLGLVLLYWLWKYVLPTLTITASLSVTSGPSGTAFNVVVNSMNGTTPDANDTVVVTVTAPDKSTSSLTGTTDASGNATIATSAGALAGAYTYAVAVGGEAGPVLTFTQSLNPRLFLLQLKTQRVHSRAPERSVREVAPPEYFLSMTLATTAKLVYLP